MSQQASTLFKNPQQLQQLQQQTTSTSTTASTATAMGATAPPPKASHGDIAVVEIVDGGKNRGKGN